MITKKAVNQSTGAVYSRYFQSAWHWWTHQVSLPALVMAEIWQTELVRQHSFSFTLPPTCKDTILQQHKPRSRNQRSQGCPCHHPAARARASPFLFASASAETLTAPAGRHTAEPQHQKPARLRLKDKVLEKTPPSHPQQPARPSPRTAAALALPETSNGDIISLAWLPLSCARMQAEPLPSMTVSGWGRAGGFAAATELSLWREYNGVTTEHMAKARAWGEQPLWSAGGGADCGVG